MKAESEKFIGQFWCSRLKANIGLLQLIQPPQNVIQLRRFGLCLGEADSHRIRIASQRSSPVDEALKNRGTPTRKWVQNDVTALRPSQNVPTHKRFGKHREIWAD